MLGFDEVVEGRRERHAVRRHVRGLGRPLRRHHLPGAAAAAAAAAAAGVRGVEAWAAGRGAWHGGSGLLVEGLIRPVLRDGEGKREEEEEAKRGLMRGGGGG